MTTSTTKTSRSAFWQGARAALPFTFVVAPFGLLFGVLAAEAGLDLFQIMGFTVLVVAGAAQFTALTLMLDDAPTLIILTTSLAVNLRMAMYSAALTPHLGKATIWQRAFAAYTLTDQAYALSTVKFEDGVFETLGQKLAFYFGTALPIIPLWYGSSFLGAAIGQSIPAGYPIDFIFPVAFIAMVAPALRTLPHIVAAFVAVTASLLLGWVPYSGGVIVAALLAMAAGAETERRMQGARV
ncbi:AzlC family ABC transporter permease [Alphaproteobacteria bacterium KMM 3653]|uniref:AzlC family ABC transporter permease n=1 Tax=Harenicola maris TaxID=2841044 RepID=A0AAP2G879_9RHOB|nr:AzlC family ABC transporter permease [Harenicola maris]